MPLLFLIIFFISYTQYLPPISTLFYRVYRVGPAAELGMTVGRLLGFRFLNSGDSQRQLILAAAGTY